MGLDLMGMLVLGGAAVGGAAGFYNTFSQAQAAEDAANFQSKMAKYNSELSLRNAEVSRNQAAAQAAAIDNQTDAEAARLRRQAAFAMSENRSLLGASGLQNTGSNLLFEIDNAITASMDVQNTLINGRYKAELARYEGAVKAYQFESEAANYAAQAKYYQASARGAALNKWIGSPLAGLSGAISGAAAGGMAGNALGAVDFSGLGDWFSGWFSGGAKTVTAGYGWTPAFAGGGIPA